VEFSQGSGLLLFVRTRSLALATVAVSWVMLGHVIDSQSGYLPNKMELGGAWNGTQPSTCCSLRVWWTILQGNADIILRI
jgi:hypothetical protein